MWIKHKQKGEKKKLIYMEILQKAMTYGLAIEWFSEGVEIGNYSIG